MNNANEKKKLKTKNYDALIFVIIALYICIIVLFALWIPKSNLPIKNITHSNNPSRTYSRGTISYGNLWKTYFGKTESEVRKIAPMYEEQGDDYVLLDTYEEDDATIGLVGGFENGKVCLLDISIMNFSRNSSACSEKLKDMTRYSAKRFATWMGFNLDNLNSWTYDEYDYGNYGNAYMTSTDLPGAKCSFDLCPRSFIGFMCTGNK